MMSNYTEALEMVSFCRAKFFREMPNQFMLFMLGLGQSGVESPIKNIANLMTATRAILQN